MPTAGWYADPEQAWMWRWWDGQQWTEVRSPMGWAPAPKDPHSFSSWFEQSTEAVKQTVRRVGLIVAGAYLACFALIWLVVYAAFTSSDGEELRDILELDRNFGGNSEIELTSAEQDRVWDLLGDLLRTWAPAFVVLSLLLAAISVGGIVLAARAAADPNQSTASLLRDAVRRLPAVIACYFVLVVLLTAAAVGPLVPLIVAIAADAGSGAIGVSAALGIPAAIVLACWLGGRLSLALVGAALGGHGLGIGRSWDLTRSHYWGVVGRLIVASIIASIVTMPLSFVSGFAAAISFMFLVMFMLVIQAVSSAASVLVTAPAQVVLWNHLSEQADGSS